MDVRRCLILVLRLLLLAGISGGAGPTLRAAESDPAALVRDALAAEARLDPQRALDLFLAAEKARPEDPFILQKIARQYSDLADTLPTPDAQRQAVTTALTYAERAVALAPGDAVNVLSLAICYGKLGTLGDTRAKVAYSRQVKDAAERALALDPGYAWAHHVLGRWHHEVVAIGASARFFVRLFYGGLPSASQAEAVRHLERAVALEPGELAHHLELGLALLAAGQPAPARVSLIRGLGMPSRAPYDEPAKARARAALARLP